MSPPKSKTQQILSYCTLPKTSVQVRAKFGACKSLLTALRNAECITSERIRLDNHSRTWIALYKATGKPYVARRGPKLSEVAPPGRDKWQAYAQQNRERLREYAKRYRAINGPAINARNRAKTVALRNERLKSRKSP